jgi:hypothetical protein
MSIKKTVLVVVGGRVHHLASLFEYLLSERV